MTGSAMRILRDSLGNGKVILSTGDKNLCHQTSPFERFIWEDASDQLYLAGFRHKERAMQYAKFMGWVK